MKKLSIFLLIASGIFLTSCNSETKSTEKVETKTVVVEENNKKVEDVEKTKGLIRIKPEQCIINWSAEGVGHGHNGTINIHKGKIVKKEDMILNGKFLIDMSSIKCLDIADAGKNKDLVDHLIGEDFFYVKKFPTAKIEFVFSDENNNYDATMTIKGISQSFSIPIEIVNSDNKVTLKSNFSIDRTKFRITYNSGNFFKDLGDYMIDDEIKFEVIIDLK